MRTTQLEYCSNGVAMTIPQNAPRDYSPLAKRDGMSPRLETPTRKRNRRAWVQIAMFLHADKVKSQKGAA